MEKKKEKNEITPKGMSDKKETESLNEMNETEIELNEKKGWNESKSARFHAKVHTYLL